ncbi:MAG: recombinase family protein [Ruminiclostridium sp.]|uniref:recombinase family protein n=1 Tax=Ruminococcus sp. TaxID=41978 RepID=UPI0025D797FE|nr:recombinase family protein [Ruminococcus sp.]MBR1432437.1 recombinase family protein [Ruminococcus sp.]MBR1833733.1 recombinase family protein [Ruminiclostridium sp.]
MNTKTKVAAYCRVSTDCEDQLNSLSVQIGYFTEYISNQEDWELIEVYYDEGITGTSTKKRDGFNRMIADCEAGKIQLILTKEVSRFARNTVDTLTYTRKLTDLHIRIIFMNDGIDTNDKDGELRLSIMASIAQEESRKMSERLKWGMKRRMENGQVLGCGRIYGFKVIDGKLEIVPKEAEIVKDIYNMYLYDGMGSTAIAHELDNRGIPTLKNRVWSSQLILKILKNEKYCGDLTQWKVYKPNVLSDKMLTNRGDNPDAPLITVKNHHEPIISKEMWEQVQAELARRSNLAMLGKKHSHNFWLSGKIQCGKCGYSYVRCSSSQKKFRAVSCRNRIAYGKERRSAPNGELVGCDNHSVDERIVIKAMESIVSQMSELRLLLEQEMLSEVRRLEKCKKDFDPAPLRAEIESYENKKRKAIDLVLDGLISKDDLTKQTTFYDSEIVRLTEEITKLQNVAENQRNQLSEIEKAIEYIGKLSDTDTDGDNKELYRSMINKIIVPEYPVLQIFLNGVPFAYKVVYSVKNVPLAGIFDITIDTCEVMS